MKNPSPMDDLMDRSFAAAYSILRSIDPKITVAGFAQLVRDAMPPLSRQASKAGSLKKSRLKSAGKRGKKNSRGCERPG